MNTHGHVLHGGQARFRKYKRDGVPVILCIQDVEIDQVAIVFIADLETIPHSFECRIVILQRIHRIKGYRLFQSAVHGRNPPFSRREFDAPAEEDVARQRIVGKRHGVIADVGSYPLVLRLEADLVKGLTEASGCIRVAERERRVIPKEAEIEVPRNKPVERITALFNAMGIVRHRAQVHRARSLHPFVQPDLVKILGVEGEGEGSTNLREFNEGNSFTLYTVYR